MRITAKQVNALIHYVTAISVSVDEERSTMLTISKEGGTAMRKLIQDILDQQSDEIMETDDE